MQNLQLAIHHKDKELKLISFGEFEKLYHENLAYKEYILNEGKGVFRHNLTQYIKTILPSASLSFVDEEILWCGALPLLGFFIIAKDK